MADVWAPGTEAPSLMATPAPVVTPLLGGGDLIGLAFKEMQADPWAWGKAGLGFALPIVGVVVAALIAIIVPTFAGLFSGDENLALIGNIVGLGACFLLLLAFLLVGSPLLAASFYRAADRHLSRLERIGFNASWSTLTTDLGRVFGTQLLVFAITMVGIIACYLPGLIAGIVLSLAVPLVAIRGLGPVDAVKQSFQHAKNHTAWFVVYWLIGVIVMMVISYIPCIGIAIALPFYTIYHILGIRVLEIKETA